MIEIQTTIKNGLPVLAVGNVIVERETRWEPGGVAVEDLEILWLSGHVCHIEISAADEDRIIEELLIEGCAPRWTR